MELLSPAGSYKNGIAAIKAGANAIYFGVQDITHQRSSCTNFSNKDIITLHSLHPKIKKYIAFNSSYNDENTISIQNKIKSIHKFISGVIISDIGLIIKLKQLYPNLKYIFSVQGQCLNSQFAKLLKKIGIDRIVLDRNISLSEALKIKKDTNLEIEIFGFGYQCYSQDSICYLGDYFGNDPCGVMCAQQVKLGNSTKRHFFMKYYSILDYIPKLLESNIDSVKIEGRQRSSKYTYDMTKVFREAIDTFKNNKIPSKSLIKQWKKVSKKSALGLEITKGQLMNDYSRKTMKNASIKNAYLYGVECIHDFTDSLNIKKFKKMITSITKRNFKKP